MTLASYISCLRMVLIVPIIYLLDQGWWAEGPSFYNYIALVLFVVAGLTDYLDGYIARKTDTETQLGALLDLIADKLLVSLIMVWMVFLTFDPLIAVAALMIVSRELVISTLRQYVIEKKVTQNLGVSFIGKSKTTIQIIAISTLILAQEIPDIRLLSILAIWFAAIFSLYSLFTYVSEWFKQYLN
jgi:CDP-diacylglycerol--glycerol-3-phosphate 3-phosphatidyltransferase